MSYEILKHTADVRLKITSNDLRGLFTDAFRGMMKILKEDIGKKNSSQTRIIKLDSLDETTLLVDFLNEVLSNAEINNEVYSSVRFEKLTDKELEAEINGYRIDGFDEDIKAVTYHEADVRKNTEGKWETMLIFDI